MGGRKGFTLIELLVCVAILAVLLALLLPLVARVRGVAMNTVCTSRLRDLTIACNAYRLDFDDFPKLGPGRETPLAALAALVNLPQPQVMDAPFLNAIGRYLNVPAIGAGVSASDLPPMMQCPMVEDVEAEVRDTLLPVSFAAPSFYTGYAYVGRVDEQPPALPLGLRVELLRPNRAASRKNASSAVLWSDDVHWAMAGGGAWSYGHRKPGKAVRAGPLALSLESPAALGGQHRAFNDGHIEWVPADSMEVNLELPDPLGLLDPLLSPRDSGASLRINPIFYSWF
jgi:prepilin-type N-terminal cleavage/methylation domain-containing protein